MGKDFVESLEMIAIQDILANTLNSQGQTIL
jgi:hypothetical protein